MFLANPCTTGFFIIGGNERGVGRGRAVMPEKYFSNIYRNNFVLYDTQRTQVQHQKARKERSSDTRLLNTLHLTVTSSCLEFIATKLSSPTSLPRLLPKLDITFVLIIPIN